MADPIYAFNTDADGNEMQNLYAFTGDTTTSRLRRLEGLMPKLAGGSPVYNKLQIQSPNLSSLDSNGNINTASSSVAKIGGALNNTVTGRFAYVSDTSSITWYWDGTHGSQRLIINRADNTIQVVPAGSITITGLSATTTYYFLPFWPIMGACNVAWVVGTVGSPQIAFTVNTDQASASLQTLQDREQLSAGFMSGVTQTSGSGGGGAGGGGGIGGCVMTGTDIEPIGDYGQMQQRVVGWQDWHRIETYSGLTLYGTDEHPVYVCEPEQAMELEDLINKFGYEESALEKFKFCMGDVDPGHMIVTRQGVSRVDINCHLIRMCSKRVVELARGHLYWANGILSHNKQIVNP